MRKTLFFIAEIISISLTAMFSLHGQSKPIATIDSTLTEMTRQDLFSGAVLIANGSKILLSKGYGYADRENKVKNTPDTRFDISTNSNIFTGTAITYLAQQGKLKFTDTIEKYIKGLPNGNRITIHQLLTHTAGLDDFWKAKDFSYAKVKNCTDIMPIMRTMPLAYKSGDSCQYSSGDLMVLGAVVEKITKMTFPAFIKVFLIQPLGLKNTCFTPYWTLDESQRQYAIGYRKTDLGFVRNSYNYDNGFIPLSAGGDWSSTSDLYKFDKAVFSGKIVNENYLKRMTTQYTSPWENTHFGYVWMITNKKGYSTIGHMGTSSGWNTFNEYYPKQKYTIIILTNFGSVEVDKLSEKIEQILFDKGKNLRKK